MAKLIGLPWFTMMCVIAGCVAGTGCTACIGGPSPAGGPSPVEGMHRSEPALWSPTSAAAVAGERDAVIIGKLELRNAKLVVFARGKAGEPIRFSVVDRKGNATGEALTEADLSLRFPGIYQAYRQALAKEQPFPDARLDLSRKFQVPEGADRHSRL
ncbi:MAG TPA: hypothetical protein VIV60_22845 [Polyangiaceae bacterium]